MNGVEKAITSIGSADALAKKVGVSYESVRLWRKDGVVPQGNVFKVEDVTGVSCFELNPIAYPRDRFQEYAKAG